MKTIFVSYNINIHVRLRFISFRFVSFDFNLYRFLHLCLNGTQRCRSYAVYIPTKCYLSLSHIRQTGICTVHSRSFVRLASICLAVTTLRTTHTWTLTTLHRYRQPTLYHHTPLSAARYLGELWKILSKIIPYEWCPPVLSTLGKHTIDIILMEIEKTIIFAVHVNVAVQLKIFFFFVGKRCNVSAYKRRERETT